MFISRGGDMNFSFRKSGQGIRYLIVLICVLFLWGCNTGSESGNSGDSTKTDKTVTAKASAAVSVINETLSSGAQNRNIKGTAGSKMVYTDAGGQDSYTILPALCGDVEIIDNDVSTIYFPAGLNISSAQFLSDKAVFTINGFSLTLSGNPSAFNFVFAGSPMSPASGVSKTYAQTTEVFGTTVPASGQPTNLATIIGTVQGNGSLKALNIDALSPSLPSGLTASSASSASINLAWSASIDNIGVTGYRIYRDGTLKATVNALAWQETGLTASTSYCYTVSAIDAAGNESAKTPQVCATTVSDTVAVVNANSLGLNESFDSSATGDSKFKYAYISINGAVVAQALLDSEGVSAFNTGNLEWEKPSGQIITDWSFLFNTSANIIKAIENKAASSSSSKDVTVSALLANGTTVNLGNFSVSRSEFSVDVTSSTVFPVDGPRASAEFTATPKGGRPPYTYKWQEVILTSGNYICHDHGSSASVTIELPSAGEAYSFDSQSKSNTNNHPIELTVTDSDGKKSNIQIYATVTQPHKNGNPDMSGSGSRAVDGVDVASGNMNRTETDLSVPCKGPDFVITRAYNSLSETENKGSWSFNIEASISHPAGSFGRQIVVSNREDGRIQRYYKDVDGQWYALNPGNFDRLVQQSDSSFVLYTQGDLLYRFSDPSSAGGRLLSIEDREGLALSFSYSGKKVSEITDASGRKYTISRDASGRISKITDFTGRYVGYEYNADSMLISFRDARGFTSGYSYGTETEADRSRLEEIKDACSNTQVKIQYDTSGRVQSLTDGLNNVTSFQYAKTDGKQVTAVRRPSTDGINNNMAFILDDGRTRVLETINAHNYGDYKSRQYYAATAGRRRIAENNLVSRMEKPSGAGTDITYTDDGSGNPSTIKDALNRAVHASWTTVESQLNLTPLSQILQPGVAKATRYQNFTKGGKPGIITDPIDQTVQNTYTGGLLDSTTDAKGNTTNIEHDDRGNVIRITDALGNKTEFTYDSLGRKLTERNPRGNVTSYTYDENGNLLTVKNASGGVTTNTYDACNKLVSVKDPRGNAVVYSYDSLGRKTSEKYMSDGIERTRSYEYDALGRVKKVINEKGNATEMKYDARSYVSSTINPLSETISYSYDSNGNVSTVTDAEGHIETKEYDQLDRLIKATDALGYYETYAYNTQGLVSSFRDKRGKVTTYEYDAIGQLVKTNESDGGVTLAAYDKNGNPASVTDRRGNVTAFTYDVLDRMVLMKDAMNRSWRFEYDENGNLVARTTPDGGKTSYSYDVMDRLVSVSYPGGPSVSYTYDANGNRVRMQDSNGTTNYAYDEQNRLVSVTDAFGNTVSYAFDAAGQLEKLTYPGSRTVSYVNDNAGRLKSLTDWSGQTTIYTRDRNGSVRSVVYGNGAKIEKSYDNAGRLTSLINRNRSGGIISSHALTLDGLGNPVSAALDLPLMPANLGRAAEMIYDASNRLTKVGSASMTHDENGRMTVDSSGTEAIQYVYNAQDLITKITRGGVVADIYIYDGDGRRIARTEGSTTTRYVIDPSGGDMYSLLAETDSANNVQRYYIYGEGLVAQVEGSAHHYYHFDQSENTIALTDSSGAMSDSYAYEPFGNTTSKGRTLNPFRFCGRVGVMDDGNGLHHMRARYYRPDLRRFVSLDPLTGEVNDPQSLNRYAYVKGNPIVLVDPMGLFYGHDFIKGVGNWGNRLVKSIEIKGEETIRKGNEVKKRIDNNIDEVKNYVIDNIESYVFGEAYDFSNAMNDYKYGKIDENTLINKYKNRNKKIIVIAEIGVKIAGKFSLVGGVNDLIAEGMKLKNEGANREEAKRRLFKILLDNTFKDIIKIESGQLLNADSALSQKVVDEIVDYLYVVK